ncbi:uncharacterized protein LOC125945234 [Dermacentor silvarum]|uniref:uncharacterized protein LOC125945234 n=1 Tax=Dermacentor silvarum TaxID=543639 RepID=UPI00210148FC|nr:uncharacterized protein LOC125945234 [Dermacentor silvarum]
MRLFLSFQIISALFAFQFLCASEFVDEVSSQLGTFCNLNDESKKQLLTCLGSAVPQLKSRIMSGERDVSQLSVKICSTPPDLPEDIAEKLESLGDTGERTFKDGLTKCQKDLQS